MKLNTIIKLPDGRVGTICYNGLGGIWGIHHFEIPEDDDELPTPEFILRDKNFDTTMGAECVGEHYEIVFIDPLFKTNPVLKGEDADRFIENMVNVKPISKEEIEAIESSYQAIKAMESRTLHDYDKLGVCAYVYYSITTGGFAVECYRKKTKEEREMTGNKEWIWAGHIKGFDIRPEAESHALKLAESVYNEFKDKF